MDNELLESEKELESADEWIESQKPDADIKAESDDEYGSSLSKNDIIEEELLKKENSNFEKSKENSSVNYSDDGYSETIEEFDDEQ